MVRRIALLANIVAIITAACSQSPTTSFPSSSPIRTGSVVWADCGGGFQCGTVQVPLDYSHPDAGTIDIAVNRKPATDRTHRIGSLLINPGGPGDSGVTFVRDDVSALTNLNQRFDLIGFDPRGVGQSSPVHCLSDTQKDAINALDPVLDDPQEKQATVQASKDFAAACAQRNAKILPFVDTVSAAKDMDLIRAAVGDAKLTYLGFSYGTLLGQTYAHLFPTHIRALALESVVDPAVSSTDMLEAQLVGFEQNYQAFLADCKARRSATPPCTYSQSGDPATKLNALLLRLDSNPMNVGGRMLTRGLALTGVLYGLYYQIVWPDLDLALTTADRGDGRVLLALADQYNQRNPDGSYTNFIDAIEAIDCIDRPYATDIAVYDQLGPAFSKISPLIGPLFQYSDLTCAYWPVKPIGHVGPLTVDGAPPILVVGASGDPATPYAWAQSVHQQLVGSILLTRAGQGHAAGDNVCINAAEEAYLISLTLPAPDTVCH
jgi:pimeloyl-ACP methyl ester carboxylesterase